MIYLKTSVSDGIYSVNCYNSAGVEITSAHTITSKIYRKETTNEFTFLLETSEKVLELHPDVFENLPNLYVTVYVDDELYKTYLKTTITNSTKVLKYTFLYKSQTPLVETSTPFLDRFNYFMPRWSTAYKNDVTNFSKITYPLFANIEKCFFKTSKIVTESLYEKETFKKRFTARQSTGKVVGKDGVERKYTYNIENSPITRVGLNSTSIREQDLKEITLTSLKDPVRFKKASSKLFITSPLNSTVTFSGVTLEGATVIETFEFNTPVVKQSKYSYKILFYFESSSKESVIRNFLDCEQQHLLEKPELLPIFIDENKEQQFPQLSLEDNTLYLRYVKDGLFEYDSNFYKFDKALKAIYVTESQDVIGVDTNNNLCTGLLRKNLEVDMPLINNNNNNSYVYVSAVEPSKVSFSIKTKEILEDLSTSIVTIKVQSDKNTFYIDSNTEEFTEKQVSYFLDGVNSLDFDINVLDGTRFVSVIISTPTANYQASHRFDNIPLTTHLPNCTKLYFINNAIYALEDSNLKEIELKKDYYEVDQDGSLLLQEKDLTIYSLKGVKLSG